MIKLNKFNLKTFGGKLGLFIFLFIGCIAFFEMFVPSYNWVTGNLIAGTQTAEIKPGVNLTQPFTAVQNNLSGLQICFNKTIENAPANAKILWKLFAANQPDSILAEGEILFRDIQSGECPAVRFPSIAKSAAQQYSFQISTQDQIQGLSIQTSPAPQSIGLIYQLNHQNQTGTMVFKTGYSGEKQGPKLLLGEAACAAILWMAIIWRKKWIAALENIPLHKSVPVIILVTGLCFLIIEPPLHMFDEPEHFRRAWDVSQGKLIPTTENGVISTQLPDYIQFTFDRIVRTVHGDTQNPAQIWEMLHEKPGDIHALSERILLSSSYSFFAYLLPAILIRFGILVKSSALGLLYLARLANLLQYTCLTAWALHNAKKGKLTISVLALLGLMVTQGTAISVDSLLLGGSFLFIASVLNIALDENKAARPLKTQLWGIIVGAFCILIAKHVYIPLLALTFIIPLEKFGTLKKKILVNLAFWFAAGVFAIALQSMTIQGVDPRIDYTNINIHSQMLYLAGNPIRWFRVFFNTLINNSSVYLDQFNILNGTNVGIGLFGILQFGLVLFFAWTESEDFSGHFSNFQKIIIWCVAFAMATFIMLPLYLFWTQVGAETVAGLQGRYFAPLITLLLLCFKPAFKYNLKHLNAALVCSMTFLLINQIWSAISLFY
jgi:uncharacterized membrane protein